MFMVPHVVIYSRYGLSGVNISKFVVIDVANVEDNMQSIPSRQSPKNNNQYHKRRQNITKGRPKNSVRAAFPREVQILRELALSIVTSIENGGYIDQVLPERISSIS